jgi:hypothetical protein
MKKKSPRDIPDFAHHPPAEKHGAAAGATPERQARPHEAPSARVKPHATSAKSGRRGQ